MNRKLRSIFKLYVASTLYWLFAFMLLKLLRYGGMERELSYYLDEAVIFPTEAFYESGIFLGVITGIIYTIVETTFEALSKKIALGLTILFKALIYFVVIIFLLSITSQIVENDADINLPNDALGWWTTYPNFWNTVIYFIFFTIAFQLVRIALDRFGTGNFLKVLVGKYKQPKEEAHILMFLDLKDSTTIAEELGHHLYSKFIQDCFTDLDRVLSRFDARVYQYVGDEAVLHWSVKNGFKNNNCVQLFSAFSRRLKRNKKYYMRKYNFQPQFKAGIHFGKIMVAEVGSSKKELAFHGDVINTAARIQGRCNEFDKPLLVSGEVLNKLSLSEDFYELLLGDIELKGKSETIKLYAINI